MRRALLLAGLVLLLGSAWHFATQGPPVGAPAPAPRGTPAERALRSPGPLDRPRAVAVDAEPEAPRGAATPAPLAPPNAALQVSRVRTLRGAAIPDFEFEARRGTDGPFVRLRTDATGAFDASGLAGDGFLELRRDPSDRPPRGYAGSRVMGGMGIALVCPDPAAEHPRVIASVGHAFRVRLAPNPGLPPEELVARLRVIGSTSRMSWIATGSGLRGSDALLEEGNADVMHWGTAAAVHPDPEEGYRVVFGDGVLTHFETPGQWYLSVESLDGSYFAESRVRLDRREPELLRWLDAELTEVRGRLLSIALHGDGQPAAGRIQQLGLNDIVLAELTWTSNTTGRQEFLPAPRGRYRLLVGGVRHESSEHEFTFDARRNLHLDFDLQPRAAAGELRGRVRNAELDDPDGAVTLRLHGDAGAYLQQKVRLRSSGRARPGVALFAFSALPEGTYRLEALSVGDDWLPLEVEARPGDSLELVRRRR